MAYFCTSIKIKNTMENILRIAEILKEKGISGKQLAVIIGKDPVTLSRIISGRSGTNLSTIVEIANALDVDVRDLFYSSKEDPIYRKEDGQYVKIGSIKRA